MDVWGVNVDIVVGYVEVTGEHDGLLFLQRSYIPHKIHVPLIDSVVEPFELGARTGHVSPDQIKLFELRSEHPALLVVLLFLNPVQDLHGLNLREYRNARVPSPFGLTWVPVLLIARRDQFVKFLLLQLFIIRFDLLKAQNIRLRLLQKLLYQTLFGSRVKTVDVPGPNRALSIRKI